MLDYRPMTAAEHRARWAAATACTWDFSDVAGRLPLGRDRPGLHPENVFDFHDGLRLIVSVDRYASGPDHLHVSGSYRDGSAVDRRCKKKLPPFTAIVRERVRYLSGRDVTLGYVTAPKGVPHYFDPPLMAEAIAS